MLLCVSLRVSNIKCFLSTPLLGTSKKLCRNTILISYPQHFHKNCILCNGWIYLNPPFVCSTHCVHTSTQLCLFKPLFPYTNFDELATPPPQERHASKVYAVKVCYPTKGKNAYNLILQVECIVDISQPYYSQMQKIRNEENANVQVSATQPTVRHFQNIVIPCTVQHIHSMFMRRSRYI